MSRFARPQVRRCSVGMAGERSAKQAPETAKAVRFITTYVSIYVSPPRFVFDLLQSPLVSV